MAERVHRDAVRRRTRFIAAGLVIVLAGTLFYLYARRGHSLSPQARVLISQAPAAARAAGCTSVQVVPPYPDAGLDRGHIGGTVPSAPALSTYSSIPPASGPHDPVPLDAGVYRSAPPIYRAIHSLEHGAVIVWRSPTAPPSAVDPIERFFAQPGERDHVIVAPYDYPNQGSAGALPAGQAMVLVAWHHIQRCRDVSLPVARAFVQGTAPLRGRS